TAFLHSVHRPRLVGFLQLQVTCGFNLWAFLTLNSVNTMKRLAWFLTGFWLSLGISQPVAAQQRLVSSVPVTDIFRSPFSSVGAINSPPQAVELSTDAGQSVLTLSKDGVGYGGNFYKLVKKNKRFSLESPTASQPLGTIATNWKSFTLPNGQVFTRKKQKGSQIAFASADQPVAAIQYKRDKHQKVKKEKGKKREKSKGETYSVSIENKGSEELAPFLFLAAINDIHLEEAGMDWLFLSFILL
ncbi:MAG TPA: hypothetical protein VK364_00365, partial [Hymenobacter sp.]|nr:hypothetical protein [Hymenobacter sp.]